MTAVLHNVQYIENTQDCESDLITKEENNDNLTKIFILQIIDDENEVAEGDNQEQ
jgi:hypothetical protein